MLAGTKEQESALLIMGFKDVLQQISHRARVRDFNSSLTFRLDATVTKLFHPSISPLTRNLRKRVLPKIGSPTRTPDANIDEEGWPPAARAQTRKCRG
jgi:hypothetical protein